MFKIIENFKLEIDQKEIFRLLGHSQKVKRIKVRSEQLVEEMIDLSPELIEPKGIYTIEKSNELRDDCLFTSAEKVAFCICTIGKELERKVEDLTSEGKLTRAVILDAIGSVAAESTAEHLTQIIIADAKRKNLYCSARFSPGYGGWRLEGQKYIFDLLPAKRIGVRLNQSYMMIPRKSVSFAVNLSGNPSKIGKLTPCETCGLKNCMFKKK